MKKNIEVLKIIPLGLLGSIAIITLGMGVKEYHVQGQVTGNVVDLMELSVTCTLSLQGSKVKQSKKSDSNSEEGN